VVKIARILYVSEFKKGMEKGMHTMLELPIWHCIPKHTPFPDPQNNPCHLEALLMFCSPSMFGSRKGLGKDQ
jgi:hypothetical protein